MRTLKRLAPSLFLIFPGVAFAAAARTFQELALSVAKIIDTATITLVVLGLVVYFWGMAVNIPHFGDEKGAEKQKAFFFWGILILFVMVSIWGIIQLLQNTLFGNNPLSPSTGEPAYTLCDSSGNCGFGNLSE